MAKNKTSRKGTILAISLLLAVLVFILMVVIAKALVNKKEATVAVVVARENIPAGSVIAKDASEQYFALMQVPEAMAYHGCYQSYEEMFTKGNVYLTQMLFAGEIVGENMMTVSSHLVEGFKDPVEMGVKVGDFADAAGGILRRGDTVELCCTDDLGEEKSVKTSILQAFDGSGNPILSDDTSSVAVAFNILIERSDYVDVAEIVASGIGYDLIKLNDVY